MKKVALFILIFLAGYTAFSQRVYFVYLQTEQDQPFFVKMNDQVYSSASSGYLILSKLHDSTYNFSIGFPQNKWPEQNFSVKIGAKDHGYVLKNFENKGWGLFDLQTMAVQMAAADNKKNENSNQTNVSPFTDILAKATGDSTLKQKPVETITEEKKTAIVEQTPLIKKDSANVKSSEAKIENTEQKVTKAENKMSDTQHVVNIEEPKIIQSLPYKRSTIIRKSESSTTASFVVIYIDDYGTGKDTIQISIPEPSQTGKNTTQQKKSDVKFLDIVIDSTQVPVNNNASQNQNEIIIKKESGQSDSITNKINFQNNCLAVADDKDFFELRKNMASSNGNDDMLETAKKYFKEKCFSTTQLKNLSALFLDDAGKYNFFDAAYNHVSDVQNFSNLQSELKDSYYINRFKAMLRN